MLKSDLSTEKALSKSVPWLDSASSAAISSKVFVLSKACVNSNVCLSWNFLMILFLQQKVQDIPHPPRPAKPVPKQIGIANTQMIAAQQHRQHNKTIGIVTAKKDPDIITINEDFSFT